MGILWSLRRVRGSRPRWEFEAFWVRLDGLFECLKCGVLGQKFGKNFSFWEVKLIFESPQKTHFRHTPARQHCVSWLNYYYLSLPLYNNLINRHSVAGRTRTVARTVGTSLVDYTTATGWLMQTDWHIHDKCGVVADRFGAGIDFLNTIKRLSKLWDLSQGILQFVRPIRSARNRVKAPIIWGNLSQQLGNKILTVKYQRWAGKLMRANSTFLLSLTSCSFLMITRWHS